MTATQIKLFFDFMLNMKLDLNSDNTGRNWDEFDILRIKAAPSKSVGLKNLINNGHNSTEIGTIEFTANRGMKSNGSSYLRSNYTPSTDAVKFTQDSGAIGIWTLEDIADAGYAGGWIDTSNSNTSLIVQKVDGNTEVNINQTDTAGTFNPARANQKGLIYAIRDTDSDVRLRKHHGYNDITSFSKSSAGLGGIEMYEHTINNDGSPSTFDSSHTQAVFFLGSSNVNFPAFYMRLRTFLQGTGAISFDTAPIHQLAGQSNMDGTGVISEMPVALQGVIPNSKTIDWEGSEVDGLYEIEDLEAGVNNYGAISTQAGPELKLMNELSIHTGSVSYLFKNSFGGTSLYPIATIPCWDPDTPSHPAGNRWVIFVPSWEKSLMTLAENELIPDVKSFSFAQGEADADDATAANNYEATHTALVAALRALDEIPDSVKILAVGLDIDLPRPHAGLVNTEKQAFVTADSNAVYINMDDADDNGDGIHWDTASQLLHGDRIFNQVKDI